MISQKIDELIYKCLDLIDYRGRVVYATPIYVEFITLLESFIKDFKLEDSEEWKEIMKYRLKPINSYLTNGETTEIIKQLIKLKERLSAVDYEFFWNTIHSEIKKLCYKKFHDQHYADAVETAYKELEVKVKAIYFKAKGEEFTGKGSTLMTTVFSQNSPIMELSDLSTENGRNIQNGFMRIFDGVMIGIRNHKAHSNSEITKNRAIHELTTASMLFYMIDNAKKVNEVTA